MKESIFTNFPVETLTFYRQLELNNNKEWFSVHKQEYLDYVQAPALGFIANMGEQLKAIAPNIVYDTRTNGAGSLMRIYRDTRFSNRVAQLIHRFPANRIQHQSTAYHYSH